MTQKIGRKKRREEMKGIIAFLPPWQAFWASCWFWIEDYIVSPLALCFFLLKSLGKRIKQKRRIRCLGMKVVK